ncbi:MAG TPA: hypothetical protein VL691_00605 [Vicinamibacteria bacterium]|nr:hypothetical protein [Vicinamibacteria bacterium]
MRRSGGKWLVPCVGILAGLAVIERPARGNGSAVAAPGEAAPIVVDYPQGGSVFPPDMSAPTFLWRDPSPDAARWLVEVTFADGSPAIRARTLAPGMRIGEIDPRCIGPTTNCRS